MPGRPRGWLLVFCLLLLVAEPVSLALVVSGRTIELTADPIAAIATGARLLVAAVGVAAGMALWTARPAGPSFAKAYLAASSILLIALVATRYAPTNLQPGLARPAAVMIVAQNALWFAYLSRSRQVHDRSNN